MTWENSRQSQVLLKGYRISLLCQPCPNIWFDTLTTGFCEAGNIALLVQCDFVSKYCSGISLPKVLIALKSQFGLKFTPVNVSMFMNFFLQSRINLITSLQVGFSSSCKMFTSLSNQIIMQAKMALQWTDVAISKRIQTR